MTHKSTRFISIVVSILLVVSTIFPSLMLLSYATGETTASIKTTIDFNNSYDYSISNDYYSYKSTSGTLANDTIKIEDGVLKLKSLKQTSTGVNSQLWILNKGGKPIELYDGVQYSVKFSLEQKTAPVTSGQGGTNYIYLTNGVAVDGGWLASGYAPCDAKTSDNSISGNNRNGISVKNETISLTASDVTNGGLDTTKKNYLALGFNLIKSQEIHIDEIEIEYTYNKNNYTFVELYDGTTLLNKELFAKGSDLQPLSDEGQKTFLGWIDDDGNTVDKIPETSDGKLKLTANWFNAFDEPNVLADGIDYSYIFDFENSADYIKSDAYIVNGNADSLTFSGGFANVAAGAENIKWMINKNGCPFMFEENISYEVKVNTNSAAVSSPIALSNCKTDSSKWENGTYTAIVTANGNTKTENYLTISVTPDAHNDIKISDFIITFDKEKHTLVTYQYDPEDINNIEKKLHKVGDTLKTVDYVMEREFKGWKESGNSIAKVKATADGKLLVVADLAADPLDGLQRYTFSNPENYETDNTTGKFWSRNYAHPGNKKLISSGASESVPVNNGLTVEGGVLKVKSGLDVDLSLYENPDYRSIQTWVVNKGGTPIELIPGKNYSLSFKVRQTKAATVPQAIKDDTSNSITFVSASNGVAYDDINQKYWWSDFGASASVMEKKDGVEYGYIFSNNAVPWMNAADVAAKRPNSAVAPWNNNIDNANKLVFSNKDSAFPTKWTTITKGFTAYDITEDGAKDRKNYLALNFCLLQGQEIEIDDISIHLTDDFTIVTYDYKDGTVKKVYQAVGSPIAVADKESIPFGRIQNGWKDINGKIYDKIPKADKGIITLYPNIVRKKSGEQIEGMQLLDFDFAEDYEVKNSSDAKFWSRSYSTPGNRYLKTDTAKKNQITIPVENGLTLEDGALKLKSGITDDLSLYDGANDASMQTWIINDGGKPIELVPGKQYTVSMKVKQTKAPDEAPQNGNLSYVALSNGVAFDDINAKYWWTDFGANAAVMPAKSGVEYKYLSAGDAINWFKTEEVATKRPNSAVSFYGNDIDKANKVIWANNTQSFPSEYTTKSVSFTAYDITENGKKDRKNYLALTFCLRKGQEIVIDDLKILENGIYNMVSFDTNNHGSIASLICKKGEVVTLTDLANTAEDMFDGWYMDSDFKNKVKGKTYTVGSKNVTFYAKWVKKNHFEDFESYPANLRDIGRLSRFEVVNNFSSGSGNCSLHLDQKLDGFVPAYARLTESGGSLKVSNNSSYFVTFDYYVEKLSVDAKVFFATSSAAAWFDNIDNKGFRKEYANDSYIISASTQGKGWQTAKLIINIKDMSYPQHNNLYLRIVDYPSDSNIYFDNIKLQLITDENKFVTICPNDGGNPTTDLYNSGDKFSLPTLTNKYMNFKGWYSDEALTKPYTGNCIVGNENVMIYGKWEYKKGVKIEEGFENYKGAMPNDDFSIVTTNPANGKKCLKWEIKANKNWSTYYISLFLGDNPMVVNNGMRFAVSFKYKLEKLPSGGSLPLSFTSGNKVNLWMKDYDNWALWPWKGNVDDGYWMMFSDTLIFNEEKKTMLKNGDSILKFGMGYGAPKEDTVIYIDDITLTPLAEDDVVLSYMSYKASNDIPDYIVCKAGQKYDIVQKGSTIGRSDLILAGWYTTRDLRTQIQEKDGIMQQGEDRSIHARWVKKHSVNGFEEDYQKEAKVPGLAYVSFDNEYYNSSVKGFNRVNVKGGANSLHRMGKSHLFKNVQVLKTEDQLALGLKYRLTFDVKMESSLHKEGSVQIISNAVAKNPYDTIGEYTDAISLEDLTDHQWHKVSLVFMSLGEYLSFRTPGYASIYFDNVQLDYVNDDTPITPSTYVANEYKPLLRDENGNVIEQMSLKYDINDSTLTYPADEPEIVEETNKLPTVYIILISVAGVAVAGGTGFGVLAVKKKSAKKPKF